QNIAEAFERQQQQLPPAQRQQLPPAQLNAWNEQVLDVFYLVHDARAGALTSSLLRSLLFIGLATGITWAYTKKYFNKIVFVIVVGAIGVTDVVMIGLIYVNEDSFVTTKKSVFKEPEVSLADQFIIDMDKQKEKKDYYRVVDAARGGAPNQNADGLFFHKSVGGYFAAKPMRYQEVYDRYNYGRLFTRTVGGYENARKRDPRLTLDQYMELAFPYNHILDMYNVRYTVHDLRMKPIVNYNACGNAWFVTEVQKVEDADKELDALAKFDPHNLAIVQEKFESHLEGIDFGTDTLAAKPSITLANYHPNKMVYTVNTDKARLAVFSEQYYPPSKGWKVYIDGQEVEGGFIKVNYLLRGLKVPAGAKEIIMEFAPVSYHSGGTYAYIASFLLIIGVVLGGYLWYNSNIKNKNTNFTEEV
ncbi:MAG: YfhO family protein, partial [Saprospiraceae bacterium]|nr:YfhO family protein [Saprospiraceae bacterium]